VCGSGHSVTKGGWLGGTWARLLGTTGATYRGFPMRILLGVQQRIENAQHHVWISSVKYFFAVHFFTEELLLFRQRFCQVLCGLGLPTALLFLLLLAFVRAFSPLLLPHLLLAENLCYRGLRLCRLLCPASSNRRRLGPPHL